jgi:formate dehydrogenase (coenzyme F420) beta subunit
MIETIRTEVARLLTEGQIQGFLGLSEREGQVAPFLFTRPEELATLSLGDLKKAGDVRYPLNKLLIHLTRQHPEQTWGVLIRGCDERGLVELFKWKQLNPARVVPVGLACPSDLARSCECPKPFPDRYLAGEKGEPHKNESVSQVLSLDVQGRLQHWLKEFSRCIKCYGCRDICPMCFCKECTLEEESLIQTGNVPPENPVFHLVRAVHMAGRCIDCGLCNEACPADIPLRTLYKRVADILEEQTGYRPGYDSEEKSPLNVLGPAPE